MAHLISQFCGYDQLTAPQSSGAATLTSSYIDLTDAEYIELILSLGSVSASATVDFSALQATDSSGTGSKAITGASLTQITSTGASKLYSLTVRAEKLDIANGFRYIASKAVVGGTTPTVLLEVVSIRYRNRHIPADATGLTQDVQVI